MDQITSFFQNPTATTILTFLSGAIIAYIPARYNATKPMKLEIKKRQFEDVYLPLYKTIHKTDPKLMSDKDKKTVLDIIKTITESHIELVFPTLSKLLLTSPIMIDEIYENIDTEYLLLKKTLGYPSENFFALFKRLSRKEKVLIIAPFIAIILISIIINTVKGTLTFLNVIVYIVLCLIASLFILFVDKLIKFFDSFF
ncbi:hypothetical protein ACH52_1782 [Eubacterium limosum]|nr:hypothetical protein ACH52_1782 [Eubacterium limosum]